MSGSERTPLLNGNSETRTRELLYDPTWLESYQFFVFGSWFNVLLFFIPLSFLSHFLEWDAALRFTFSFLAIIPLAKLLGDATDQLSVRLGQTLSGLLNASFGNAVEIIVGIAALLQGELRIVQTSMLGSILSNLLLVLGCSFLAGGLYFRESLFSKTAAQTSASLMTLSCITLVVPAAYHMSQVDPTSGDSVKNLLNSLPTGEQKRHQDETTANLLAISRGTAVILLLIYAAYLNFQLNTHSYLFDVKGRQAPDREIPSADDSPAASHEYLPASRLPTSTQDSQEIAGDVEVAKMNIAAACVALVVVTIITSFCADFLVASIEETAERYHIPKTFIGLILLPIVANAAEHVTSVWMAMKGKSELTIGICVGSSIQIATFVVPLLVIIGWGTGHELTLFFADFETVVLFMSVILVDLLIMDGKSNYMEGFMLVALYFVLALAFWVS
ncbi:calcium/proton exchanger [Schizopora paradoxa]|uniref:Vacuolar calcium ion transporter n=1 Tax=Schizopora paradoxa TaxID=27342 RepID=A0A0H2S4S7_9AGAM|nr:calcium/proton exchanger [Schizopora paradoxa]